MPLIRWFTSKRSCNFLWITSTSFKILMSGTVSHSFKPQNTQIKCTFKRTHFVCHVSVRLLASKLISHRGESDSESIPINWPMCFLKAKMLRALGPNNCMCDYIVIIKNVICQCKGGFGHVTCEWHRRSKAVWAVREVEVVLLPTADITLPNRVFQIISCVIYFYI